MSDWTPGRRRQPEKPPRLELVDRCWCVKVLATGREMVCGVFRTDAGLEVRGGYRDELIVSQHCHDLGAARAIAAEFKTKLVAEVGPIEELRAWLCGKCAGADVEEHFRTCPHRTTPPRSEPTNALDVPSTLEEMEPDPPRA